MAMNSLTKKQLSSYKKYNHINKDYGPMDTEPVEFTQSYYLLPSE